jgi:hypothetical protein
MSVEPNSKTIFQVNFALIDKVSDSAVIQALLGKRKDTMELMHSGYEKNVPKQPEAARKF